MRLLVVGKKTSPSVSRIADIGTCSAETADEGLSILRHDSSFDLVIVDIAALSEEGFSFIRRLRLTKNETPIVAITAHHSSDRVRALGLGADEAVAPQINPQSCKLASEPW